MIKKSRETFLYLIASNRTLINVFLGLTMTITTIYWVAQTNNRDLDMTSLESWWNAWGDPVLGLSTFLVAIVIWLSNTAKDWEDSITKKLTVVYKFGDREVIRCEKAYLANEGDIRNWGQTIGRQTLGQSIHFNYKIFELDQTDTIEGKNWEYHKHYIATFFLASIPSQLDSGKFLWKEGEDKPIFVPSKK